MALFDHLFPYTNLHDINLDWIISIIKSIDPAVIQALQQLTPDIIEQVNQKVSEAQAAAIAAQSSASEAKTAKENAANSALDASRYSSMASISAGVARSEADAAIEAKTAVENSLVTTYGTISEIATDYITPSINITSKTGNTAFISLSGIMSGNKPTDFYTKIGTLPYSTTSQIYIPATIDNNAVTAAILGNTLYILTSDVIAGTLRVNGGFAIG